MSTSSVKSLDAKRLLRRLEELPHEVAVSEAHGIDPAWLEAQPPGPDTARLHVLLPALRDEGELPYLRLARLLRDGTTANGPGIELVEDPLAISPGESPRWPSTLRGLDAATGGLYGVTVIGGEPGVGKSTLALASALEAAAHGWCVAYFNAELTRKTMSRRISSRLLPHAPEERDLILQRFRLFDVSPRADNLDRIGAWAAEAIEPGATRLLVVLDSINTLVKLSLQGDGEGGYFHAMARVLCWAMQARKTSEGEIAFLIVSELNRRGETKGAQADYWADLVLRLRQGDVAEYVRIDVTKSRETARPELGQYLRDWRRLAFVGGAGVGAAGEDER